MFFATLFAHWFIYSIIGMFCFGISMALYKLPAHNNEIDTNALNTWRNIVQLVFAVTLFFGSFSIASGDTIMIALLRGVLFTVLTLTQMYALTRIETNALYPVTSTLALVVVIVVGALFFGDNISVVQFFGMAIAVAAIYLFGKKSGNPTWEREMIYIGLAITVLSVISNIVHKVAADMGDIFNFQIWLYFFIFITGAIPLVVRHKKSVWQKMLKGKTFFAGLAIGSFAFIGAYALLLALMKGPLSLAQTINSAYLFVSVPIAALLFNEKLTTRKVALILVAFLAIVIIRLG